MHTEPPSRDELAAWRDDALAAASFLTRLPFRRRREAFAGELARAGWAFPLVGAVVGIAGFLAWWIASALEVAPLAAALVAVLATVLITGALHEDGLADTADGLGGGSDRDGKLAIMRDSRSGTYGVLAIVFSIALRAAALGTIIDTGAALAALVAAHSLGRGALPVVMRWLAPAREDGLGAAAGRPSATVAAVAAGIAIAIVLLSFGLGAGIAALLWAALVMALIAALARRQIGGYTGDVLGAIEQGGEIVMLLAASSW